MLKSRKAIPLVLLAGAALAVPSASSGADDPSMDEVNHAAHFRGSVGFRDGRDFVETTYQDRASFPDDSWGIPLSVDEADDLKARVKVQNSLGDAQEYSRSRERYAGVYVDQLRDGLPVFLFTGDADRYRDEIAERLPKGIEFETRTVERTWDELLDLQARISSDDEELAKDGIRYVRAGVDTEHNRIIVTLQDPDERQEAIIHDRYGDFVGVQAGTPATADACTSRYHCWPPMGGINIVPTTWSDGFCTAGFFARRTDSDQLVLATAGHCLWGPGEIGDDIIWEHDGHNIGIGRERVYQDGHDADIGIINVYQSVEDLFEPPASDPSVHRYLSADTPPVVQYMSNTLIGENQSQHFLVCRFGRTTPGGRTCGQIISPITDNLSVARAKGATTSQSKQIMKTIEVDFDSLPGDSGGPVFSDVTESVGYGLHVHSGTPAQSKSWYVPLNWARKTLIDDRSVTINWCLTSTC
ncbi:MAG: hypothetical protein U0667_13400 [Chloroflexota bacterium]